MLSGALAAAWRLEPRPDGPPWPTVMAASLHDFLWREEDAAPVLDPGSGWPRSFTGLPRTERTAMLRTHLPVVDAVDPRVGALVREHHAALLEEREPTGTEAPWVWFFDGLSLFACLTGPGADPDRVPGWLGPGVLTPPEPEQPLEARWMDDATLRLDPFPFAGDQLRADVPFREIPRRRYHDPDDLRAAWESATQEELPLRFVR